MSDLQDASETLYNSFGIKTKDQMCSVSPVLQTECISLSWAPTVSNLYSPFPVHVPPLLPAYTHTHTEIIFNTVFNTSVHLWGQVKRGTSLFLKSNKSNSWNYFLKNNEIECCSFYVNALEMADVIYTQNIPQNTIMKKDTFYFLWLLTP